jgi:hypothetical protein
MILSPQMACSPQTTLGPVSQHALGQQVRAHRQCVGLAAAFHAQHLVPPPHKKHTHCPFLSHMAHRRLTPPVAASRSCRQQGRCSRRWSQAHQQWLASCCLKQLSTVRTPFTTHPLHPPPSPPLLSHSIAPLPSPPSDTTHTLPPPKTTHPQHTHSRPPFTHCSPRAASQGVVRPGRRGPPAQQQWLNRCCLQGLGTV